MDFAVKMVFYRKSKASSIVLWNKIFGLLKLRIYTSDNIYGTRPKLMTFELTVVLTNTRDNLNNSWNFSLNATFSPVKWFIVIIFYLLWAILSKVIFFTLKRISINLFMSTCVFVYWSGNLWILNFFHLSSISCAARRFVVSLKQNGTAKWKLFSDFKTTYNFWLTVHIRGLIYSAALLRVMAWR